MSQSRRLMNARRVDPILAAVRRYIGKGYRPVPVERQGKRVLVPNWPNLEITKDEIAEYFENPNQNVGVILGSRSGWLVDIDLDCEESIDLADSFLPKTHSVFGRRGAPASHRLYVARGMPPKKFVDSSDGSMIVEIRSTGQQTVFPPSTHKSGEPIRWVSNGEPAVVEMDRLISATGRLAAATVLARHWDETPSRDELSATVIAVLRRTFGWDGEDIQDFLIPVLNNAGDEEAESRLRKIERSVRDIDKDHLHFYGLPKLAELLGQSVVDQILSWIPSRVETGPVVLRSALEIATEEISPRYIHKPYLEEGVLAVLSGEYGTYKSFLALDWALHAAAGILWPSSDHDD